MAYIRQEGVGKRRCDLPCKMRKTGEICIEKLGFPSKFLGFQRGMLHSTIGHFCWRPGSFNRGWSLRKCVG